MNTQESIEAVVTEATLPPQIDYRQPWRIKASEAWDHIKTLSKRSQKRITRKITKAIDAYYEYDEYGGSPAYYDSLF